MVTTNKHNASENLQDCEKIEGLGFSSFIYPLMFTCFIGMSTINIFSLAQVDSWISIIVGSIIGIIPFLLVMYIIKNSNGEDILTLNINIFGKVFGTIINVIINIILVLFASLILYNLSLFLDTQYIPDTSSLYVKILIMIPVIYAASRSIATISRISQAVLIINIILFLLSAIGIVSDFDMNNMLPVLAEGSVPTILGGIQYAIFAALPLFLLTIIPTKLLKNKKNIVRNSSIIYILTSIILLIMFVITTGVLGYEVVSVYKYPEYMVLKYFSLFDIIERIEGTLGIQFVFSMFVFITLIIYMCSKSINIVWKDLKLQQLLPTLLGILIIFISSIMFKNSTFATLFIGKYIPWIVGITFSIVILLEVIGVSIRNAINKKSNELVEEI